MRLRRRERGRDPAAANVGRDLVVRLAGGGETTALSLIDELGIIERVTFADVARRAAQWAGVLRESAVEAGERVLVLAGRDREWRTTLLGVLDAGAVAVPCPATLAPEAIAERARHCGASLIVSGVPRPDLEQEPVAPVVAVEDVRPRLSDHRTAVEPAPTAARDVALILYDDGPAGLRGVTHTHGSLLAQALSGPHWLGVRAGGRVLCTATDGSAESLWTMLAAWGAGAELVADVRELDAEGRLEVLHGMPVDVLWLSPDEYRGLASAEHPAWYDLSPVGRALVDDELDEETLVALREQFGLSLEGVFGLPETAVLAAGSPLRPLPGLELAIAEDRSRQTETGETGELTVRDRPAPLFAGYWNAPRATAATLRKDVFRTGIQAVLAADGSLRVLGRAGPVLELVEEEPAVADDLLEDEHVAAPLPEAAAAPAREERPVEKPTRQERRRRREAEALRLVAERARRERDELERLRRARDEQRMEQQRRLEARRLREQEKARRRGEDRSEQAARHEDDERRRQAEAEQRAREKEEARRAREQEQAAAEERRRADEERRRELDRERRAEKEAARTARRAAADAKSAERAARKEAARAAKQAAADAKAAERQAREHAARAAKEAEAEQRAAENRAREEDAARAAAEERAREEAERREREEAERREREAAERARAEQEQREREAEGQRRAEEAAHAERERAAAEEAARLEREAEERRRAEEAERLERERGEREARERLARQEAERREQEERARAEAAAERLRLEAEQREREAEERRRADEEAARRRAEDEQRRRAEERARLEAEALLRESEDRRRREEAERAAAAERQRAEEAVRRQAEETAELARVAERQAAALEAERRRRVAAERRRARPAEEGVEAAEPNPGLLARIGQYGMTTGAPPPVQPEPADEGDDTEDGERRPA